MPDITERIPRPQIGRARMPRSEMRPEITPKFTNLAQPGSFLHLAIPFVGTLQNIENGCELRIPDSDNIHLHRKECERIRRMLVQPAYCGKVILAEVHGNPHRDPVLETGQIGENLPQVLEVGASQLIFDNDQIVYLSEVIVECNSGYNVSPIRTDR